MVRPLGLLLALLVALTWAPAARSDDAELRAASDALVAYLQNPANCAPKAPCERPFAMALRQLAGASTSLDLGKLDRALSQAGMPLAQLERGGFVVGALGALVQDLVDAADACVADAETEVAAKLEGLCSSAQEIVERQVLRAVNDLASARVQRTAQRWSMALRDYSKAMRGYVGGSRTADRMLSRCRPRDCRSNDFVVFSPGGGACLSLVAPDKGTEACYDASGLGAGLGDIEGSICMLFQKFDRASLGCDLETFVPDYGMLVCTCSGSASASACLDENGWSRISSLSERLGMQCTLQGRRVNVTASTRFSVAPPSVSFLGALLPVPPSAVEYCVGDVATELDVALKGSLSVTGFGRETLEGICDLQHTVEAIEDVTVLAGTFTTVRIGSAVSCDGGASSGSCQTWVASRIGVVQQTCSIDGESLDYELESVSVP